MRKELHMAKKQYGVYAFIYKKTNGVAYIGKDSNIHIHKRRDAHLDVKLKGAQKVNAVIQADPDAYEYQVIGISPDKDWMEDTEMALIRQFKAIGQCWLNIEDVLND